MFDAEIAIPNFKNRDGVPGDHTSKKTRLANCRRRKPSPEPLQ